MMRVASIVVMGLLPGVAKSEVCPSFGLSSEYLAQVFCQQLRDVPPPATRSTRPGEAGSEPSEALPDDAWLDLAPVAEAWRSDPAKTLRLIERIRDAGGQPVN